MVEVWTWVNFVSICSIAGAVVSGGAIIYAYKIYSKVNEMEKKQKDNAQRPYQSSTQKNMDNIHQYFRDIIRLTDVPEINDELELKEPMDDESIESELELITSELKLYYQRHTNKMNELVSKSDKDLRSWIDLDNNARLFLQDIIEDLRWLKNEFFKLNTTSERQTRVWSNNHNLLKSKKYNIEKTIKKYKQLLIQT